MKKYLFAISLTLMFGGMMLIGLGQIAEACKTTYPVNLWATGAGAILGAVGLIASLVVALINIKKKGE